MNIYQRLSVVLCAFVFTMNANATTILDFEGPLPGGTLNDGIVNFNLKNVGIALQDSWTVSQNSTLLFGLRLPQFINRLCLSNHLLRHLQHFYPACCYRLPTA